MRSKETPLSVGMTAYAGQYLTDPANCSSGADWSGTVATSVIHSLMVGEDTFQYHQRVKRGELIPYTYFKFFSYEGTSELGYNDYSWSPTSCSNPVGWQNRWYYHGNHPSSSIPRWQIVPYELEALLGEEDFLYYVQAAAAKIYSSTWDAGTFTAELGKTMSMVNQAKRRLVRLIVNIFKHRKLGFPTSFPDLISKISKFWLEYRYGWRPLLYDLEDIRQSIESMKELERTRYKDRVGKNWALSSQETWTVSGTPRSLRSTKVDYYKLGVRGMVAADIQLSKARINVPLTAWELVTFSFIVDWLINVGQAIEAMSLVALSTNHTSAYGYYLSGERTVTALDAPISGPTNMTAATLTGKAESTCVVRLRQPISVPLKPRAQLRIDVPKSLDLVSLIWGALVRR